YRASLRANPESPIPNPDPTSTPHARAYLAWGAVCLIWGTTYLGIRVALETIPPLFMAAVRWLAAATLLITLLRLRGERLPAPRSGGKRARGPRRGGADADGGQRRGERTVLRALARPRARGPRERTRYRRGRDAVRRQRPARGGGRDRRAPARGVRAAMARRA